MLYLAGDWPGTFGRRRPARRHPGATWRRSLSGAFRHLQRDPPIEKGPKVTCGVTSVRVPSADVALGADKLFDSGVFRT
jgi:hypothetical protein